MNLRKRNIVRTNDFYKLYTLDKEIPQQLYNHCITYENKITGILSQLNTFDCTSWQFDIGYKTVYLQIYDLSYLDDLCKLLNNVLKKRIDIGYETYIYHKGEIVGEVTKCIINC